MSEPRLSLAAPQPVSTAKRQLPVGRHLLEQGVIAPWQLFHARRFEREWDATLPEILFSRGWINETQKLDAIGIEQALPCADLTRTPPDPTLAYLLPPETCLRHNVIPLRKVGDIVVLATGRPDRADSLSRALPEGFPTYVIASSPETQVTSAIEATFRTELTLAAETRVDAEFSCRSWTRRSHAQTVLLTAFGTVALLLFLLFSGPVAAGLSAVALCGLLAMSCFKMVALLAHLTSPRKADPQVITAAPAGVLPRISVMVPLFREPEIAPALIKRLSRLDYPKALLEVLIVLEEHDTITRDALNQTRLPHWMRVISVPGGPSGLTTKPRALNYALDHCRGEIIGIWDAEDAPQPDQLNIVARSFAHAPPDVVCLQGILDYYNPYTNWVSRCFTVEYSSWFRVILQGAQRLGLAIPLGGTTLFLRRDAIEAMGRWDAHNVTEDADLGIRLARLGYRTRMIPTVTHEEACCQFWPWVRQRSRWLKGYMVTYLVHMRQPLRLWRELGTRQFLGFQIMFGCALTQFVLAPMIWLFMLGWFGLNHPLETYLGDTSRNALFAAFVLCGLLDATIATIALRGTGRSRLLWAIPTMAPYFTLATIAAIKAVIELVSDPCYWDKTSHGTTIEGRGGIQTTT
ncbi:glycosyltransferase family 2 protein [Shimia biformata]|uniref:glycosyltransferase family 2 protein n=1 Tax=Shimia biformata TaxID=1294299 RepID=UPI00194DB780|nr:glycosyltransferase family 2 protein [Shimia biformata]